MDKLDQYRDIVQEMVGEYARFKPSNGEIEVEVIVDTNRNHFEVMHVGWDGHRRIHGPIIHIDIIGDKVWIQYNGTDRLVAEQLVAAGIPAEDIILGFQSPKMRQHSGFAVA